MSALSLAVWSIMLIADAGLVLFRREMMAIFATHNYAEAGVLVGYLGMVYVFSSQYRIFSDILSYHRKTWVISVAGILMAAVGLGMNLIFVPRFGYFASVAAIMISTLVYTIWVFLWAQRYEPLKIYALRMLFVLAVFFGMVLACSPLTRPGVDTILEKAAIYGIGAGVIFAGIKSKIAVSNLPMAT